MNRALQALWKGRLPLPEVFWGYGILGGLLVNVATLILTLALAAAGLPTSFVVLAFILHIPYNLLMLVAVWRSADRYQGRSLWAGLARVAIVIWTVAAVVA